MTHQSSRLNLIYIVYIPSFLFCILSLPLTWCWPLTSLSAIHKRRQLLCLHGRLIGIIIWIISGANNNVRYSVSVNHSRECAVHGTVDRVQHVWTVEKINVCIVSSLYTNELYLFRVEHRCSRSVTLSFTHNTHTHTFPGTVCIQTQHSTNAVETLKATLTPMKYVYIVLTCCDKYILEPQKFGQGPDKSDCRFMDKSVSAWKQRCSFVFARIKRL